jgi:hypothetical protein
MPSFGLYMSAIAAPITKNVLTSLGFGVVSYIGYDALNTTVQNAVISNLGLMASAPLGIFNMAGGSTVLGIILGAFTTRTTMFIVKRLEIY